MTLLRPHLDGRGPRPEWSWERTDVPLPDRRRRRAGRRGTGTIHSRRWPGPDNPARPEPVVVVHGLVVASGMSVPLADALAVDGPVHAPDLPGFGRSTKPHPPLDVPELGEVLTSWTQRAVDGRPVLVGTSVGAQVCLAAAAREPGAYRGIVLVSPTVDDERRRWRSQLPRWQAEMTTQSARLRLLQARDYARAGIPRAVRTFRHALRHRPEDEIRGLEVPVLVVHARRDPIVRREWATALAHRAPQGALAVLPAGVHAASHENPRELSRVVDGFVDRLRAPDTDDAPALAGGRRQR